MDYATAPPQPWEGKFADFATNEFVESGHVLRYRFYSPPIEAGKTYPLVILLHGAGERGIDDRQQLLHAGPFEFWKTYPCFVLAPQCPVHEPGDPHRELAWVDFPKMQFPEKLAKEPMWPLKLALDLLQQKAGSNPIDRDRIYVSGLSIGGFGTWDLIERNPGLFAAAIPICGGGDPAYAEELTKIPLWIFHGGADPVVKVEFSRKMVHAIEAAGGHPKFTEYPGVGHDSWSQTYANPDVWAWLFAQHR